jgi:hypothetical protein
MSATKNIYGAWTVSDIVNGFKIRRTYYGYTKREAMQIFKLETTGVLT